MCSFISCEGINIKIMLNNLGYDINLLNSLKYASVGYFYSSITPGASGGQPMQIYHMRKDKIALSDIMITLLIILCSFQMISLLYMIVAVIFSGDYLTHTLENFGIVFLIGILLNICILSVLVALIFVPSSCKVLSKISKWVINKFNFKNKEELLKKVDEEIKKYKESSIYIRKNKILFIKVLLVTALQFICSYSISYVTYKSFGFNELPYFKLISLQAVLFSSISSIPLPGSLGISEIGYEVLYKPIYGKLIKNAVVFTRLANFYIVVIINSIISIYAYLEKPKIARKK